MIAMSHMSTSVDLCDEMTVSYRPAKDTAYGLHPASVWVTLEGRSGRGTLFLSIEHVRVLAAQFPDILMTHDAAEHAAKEQAAAHKSAAESKAA